MSEKKDTEVKDSAKCPRATEQAGGSLGLKFRGDDPICRRESSSQ